MSNTTLSLPKLRLDSEIYSLINSIDAAVYRLDGMTSLMAEDDSSSKLSPSIEAFYSLLIDKYIDDAGRADFSSVYENADVQELITHYIQSLLLGQKLIKDVSKSSHIIKTIHKEFFKQYDELSKESGEFRKSGAEINNKNFSVPDDITGLMNDFENYLSSDYSYPVVVNVAIVHAMFELIHPLPFANGLVGRMLILLHLNWKKMLSSPSIIFSKVLYDKKLEYFDRLQDLAKNNNWDGWIKFFLRSFLESVNGSTSLIKKVSLLKSFEYNKILSGDFAAPSLLKLFNYTYSKPIFTIPEITVSLNITKQTAGIVLQKLIELDIVAERTGQKRNRVFTHKNFLNIVGEFVTQK